MLVLLQHEAGIDAHRNSRLLQAPHRLLQQLQRLVYFEAVSLQHLAYALVQAARVARHAPLRHHVGEVRYLVGAQPRLLRKALDELKKKMIFFQSLVFYIF